MSSSVDLINSQIDVGSIVQNLMYLERAPVRNMQSQVTALQSKLTAYQSLNTKLSALSDAVNKIVYGDGETPALRPSSFSDRLEASIFSRCTVGSSNEEVISATSSNATVGGAYSITVSSLARAQTSISTGFADTTTTTAGTGTITIDTAAADPVNITIDSTNNTLVGMRDAINNANAGVTATIINDGSETGPYKLLIRAKDTGTANAFEMTSSLSGGEALTFASSQAAGDAEFLINGVNVTKSSNTISDVVEGVTFTLKKETATPVELVVEKDVDAVVEGINGLITAYNAVNTFINGQFTYNALTHKSGVLAGDSALRRIQMNIQGQITQTVSNPFTDYKLASQIGIEFNRDGSLKLNESELRKALTDDPESVAGLFLGDANQGTSIMTSMSSVLDGLTDPLSGPIHNATDGLDRSIRSLNDMIENYELRLEKREQMLTAEFSQADQALKLLTVNQSSLSNQLASLSKSK